MKRKRLNKIVAFFITAMALFTTIAAQPAVVHAASTDSAATFQNGMLVLTPEDVSGSNPDFFKNYTKNLLPGDEVTFAINLNNVSTENVKFYFWASDTKFGDDTKSKALSDDLLSLLKLKIELPGTSTPIYTGPANGKGDGTIGATEIVGTGNSDGISLGWLSAGATSTLKVTITVPSSLGNEYQAALAAVDWTFLCEVYSAPPNNPTPVPVNPTPTPTTPTPTTIIPTPTPIDNIDIIDDETPEGSVDPGDSEEVIIEDIIEDDIPEGAIIVDDSDLGKLPQTGTLAATFENVSSISSIAFLLLVACFIVIFVRSKMKRNI